MEMLRKLVELISSSQEVPRAFGHLHLSFIFGVISLSVLLCIFFRDTNDATFRVIIGMMFLVMLVGELMKQFVFPYHIVDGEMIKNYDWSTFPFQLCSTPLYVLPFIALLPDSKLRDCFASYTMTFALIGGVAVYLVPGSVFVTNRFINIQTMVHHGLQIVSGIYVAAYYRRRFNRRFYSGGVAIFAVTFTIANILNTVVYDMLVAMGKFEDGFLFNMFYINPRLEIVIPICKDMFSKFPPVLYIAAYFVVLCALSSDIIRSASHLHEHSRKRLAKKANKEKRA